MKMLLVPNVQQTIVPECLVNIRIPKFLILPIVAIALLKFPKSLKTGISIQLTMVYALYLIGIRGLL